MATEERKDNKKPFKGVGDSNKYIDFIKFLISIRLG